MNTQHSTLNTQHSTLNTLHSTLYNLHSTLNTQHSTLNTQHSTLHTQRLPQLSRSLIPLSLSFSFSFSLSLSRFTHSGVYAGAAGSDLAAAVCLAIVAALLIVALNALYFIKYRKNDGGTAQRDAGIVLTSLVAVFLLIGVTALAAKPDIQVGQVF